MIARLLWMAVALSVLGALPPHRSARAPRPGSTGVLGGAAGARVDPAP
jgi:hypothetical protein